MITQHIRKFLQPKRIGAIFASASLTMPAAALAVEVNPFYRNDAPPANSAALTLSENGTYDSNPLRLVHNNKSLTGSETTAGLLLDSHDATQLIQLNSILNQGLYNDSAFNSTNDHEYLSLGRRNQRWDTTLDGRFDYDTTRSTEITSFGINAPNVRNTRYTIAPGVAYRATKADSFGTNLSYLHSTYDNNAFIDYHTYAGTGFWTHKLDERNSTLLSFNAQRYQTDQGLQNTTTTAGPNLGWIWQYSDDLTAHFNIGEQKTQQDSNNGGSHGSQYNYVYSGALTYHVQRYVTDAKIERAQQPSGNGQSMLLTDLNLKESYLVNDRLSLRGSVGYRMADYVGALIATNLDTEYNGSAGIAYRIIKDLDITSTYNYTHQKLIGTGSGDLTSSSFLVGLTYHPPEKKL